MLPYPVGAPGICGRSAKLLRLPVKGQGELFAA